MSITATDIQNQSFSIDRKGYDVDEVDVFLEHVADEIDLLNQQVANLQGQLAETQDALADAQEAAQAAAAEETAYLDYDAEEEEPEPEPEPEPETDEDEGSDVDGQAQLVAEYKSKIAALRKQLAEKSANDNAIAQALIVAQRSADEVIDKAHTEADRIIKDANADAERIVNKAESDRQRTQDAIRKLEDERESVRAGYRDMLNNFIDDAESKLSSIDEDYRKTAHAEHSPAPMATQPQAQVQAPAAMSNAATYHVPTNINMPAGGEQSNYSPRVNFREKDLSGFGDADDDFDFDDPD